MLLELKIALPSGQKPQIHILLCLPSPAPPGSQRHCCLPQGISTLLTRSKARYHWAISEARRGARPSPSAGGAGALHQRMQRSGWRRPIRARGAGSAAPHWRAAHGAMACSPLPMARGPRGARRAVAAATGRLTRAGGACRALAIGRTIGRWRRRRVLARRGGARRGAGRGGARRGRRDERGCRCSPGRGGTERGVRLKRDGERGPAGLRAGGRAAGSAHPPCPAGGPRRQAPSACSERRRRHRRA